MPCSAVLDASRPRALRARHRRVARRGSHRDSRGGNAIVLDETRTELRRAWSETSYRMMELRDNPQCAREQYASACRRRTIRVCTSRLTFDLNAGHRGAVHRDGRAARRSRSCASRASTATSKWRRRFIAPASTPYDVHMTDLVARRMRLDDFRGLVVCGGFSYGDVLGAGEGWAKSILFNSRLRDAFSAFFQRGGHVHARRVQRLPDDVGAARADSRHGALAALRAQSLRAVRRTPEPGRSRQVAVAVLRRHGGLAHADRGCARRGPRGVRGRERARRAGRVRTCCRCASSTTTAGRRSAIRRTRTARRAA